MSVPRVVLVEAAAELPGLFPLAAWDVLTAAELVWCRDPEQHPSAPYLLMGDVPLVALEPVEVDVRSLDLLGGPSPRDLGFARALLDLAEVEGEAVYLTGPDDGENFSRTVGLEATERGAEIEFVFHLAPPGTEVLRLAEVERRLLDPDDGCPWDLEQDHRSLGRYLVEETYELLEAIETDDDRHIAEELGDVLLQVVFHSQIAAARGAFTLDDVARGIADKLVRRHPHVFADVEVADADEVKANWEVLKQQEKGREGPFEGVPLALPALSLADKLQRRAAKLGFEWRGPGEAAERLRRELTEVELATTPEHREAEVGDLLNAAVGLARQLGVDPEDALRHATGRFRDRFERTISAARAAGHAPEDLDADTWLALWEEAKDPHQ